MILSIDVTFTAGHFHGDEWPPAPARLFQALVAATHRGTHGLIHPDVRDGALEWLETLDAPEIAAPLVQPQQEHLIHYAPNNDDGETGAILNHIRAAKTLRVYPLHGDCAVTYRWYFDPIKEAAKHADAIAAMASMVTQLGRTIDLVYARGEVSEKTPEIDGDTRSAMKPREGEGGEWLSPKPGFLALCKRRYPRSVSEMPPDFTNSRQITYGHPIVESNAIAHTLFELRQPNDELLGFPPHRLREPSGMVRHAFQLWLQRTPRMEKRYGSDRIARVLFGHCAAGDPTPSQGGHVAIVPLPSMNADFMADGCMRRVVLLGHGLHDDEDRALFADLTRGLDGISLEDEGSSEALADGSARLNPKMRGYLRRSPQHDTTNVLSRWITINGSGARIWRTVTPIILTGHMREGRTTEKCLYRVLSQQGISSDSIESLATFTGPIVPKSVAAREYRVRGYLNNTRRVHAEIIFRKPIKGPLVLGRGRFVGFGLLLPWSNC